METLLHGWPIAGLALAVPLLAWSLVERRPDGAPSRWVDPEFLLPLLWPMYLLHQFEEHGVDVTGERYAFLGAMCRNLGHASLEECPADAAFIFVVNVVACPLAFVLPYVFRRSRPLLAALGWSVPLVNAWTHIAVALAQRSYNPGLLTSVVLFLPLGVHLVRTLRSTGLLSGADVVVVYAAGVVLHVVLFGSVQLRAKGVLDGTGLLVVNALNGLVPLVAGATVLAWRGRARAAG